MNRIAVEQARREAQRFIERCNTLLATDVDTYDAATERRLPARWKYYGAPKEQGAVRRASMDLTRALAEMRRP